MSSTGCWVGSRSPSATPPQTRSSPGTVPEGSDVAVTVVGLRSVDDGGAALLGHDEQDDDEVELWLEIPRSGTRV